MRTLNLPAPVSHPWTRLDGAGGRWSWGCSLVGGASLFPCGLQPVLAPNTTLVVLFSAVCPHALM